MLVKLTKKNKLIKIDVVINNGSLVNKNFKNLISKLREFDWCIHFYGWLIKTLL